MQIRQVNMQGKIINGFELKRLLGVGGMAEVWYAENRIGRKAAVKLLLPKFCPDDNVKTRFYTEAEVMVKLNHLNIRQVYDYGELDGRPTIVMEYLEGDDLKARMKHGQRFTDEELKRWWNQLVSALNYTHQKGIVHRDIKPGNIFVDHEGNVKLLDFGIAKVRESISKTQTGQKLGTLMYMSPEQVKDSKHIDYRTDIYSLAVTFVHLITGKKPYNSDTTSDFEISEQIVYKSLDLSSMPLDWQSFLEPYLEKNPEKRPSLRTFGTTDNSATVGVSNNKDEGTIVGDAPMKQMPKKVEHQQPLQSERKPVSLDSTRGKSKKGLWIGLGVAAVAVLLLLLIKPKEELVVADPDTESYKACQTVEDYRDYLSNFGRNAMHYSEAKAFVDQYIADSTAKAQHVLAQIEAQQKAAEAERKEDAAYKKCTTISACNSYLQNYPTGRYVTEVKKMKAELEERIEQETQNEVEAPEADESSLAPSPGTRTSSNVLCCRYYFNKESYDIPARRKLNKEADDMLRKTLSQYSIKGFRVLAFASLDYIGDEEHGDMVAENRANAAVKQIKQVIRNMGMDVNKYEFEALACGPDWNSFIETIRDLNISEGDYIINQINNSSYKEKTIREMIDLYPELEKDVLPLLRCANVYVY